MGHIRVMLVDDHEMMRSSIAAALVATGEVQIVGQCANGQAAVQAARELRPDVVLMDISMPVLDGVEATRQIVQEHPWIRVVVLTALTAQYRLDEALAAGAVNVLRKDGGIDAVVLSVLAAGAPQPI